MPWKKQFDVDDARDRAKALFWSRGYEATSLEDLLTCMGINRGSFYATFGSKRELYTEVLQRYDAQNRRSVLDAARAGRTPRQAIAAIFDGIRAESCGARGKQGCFLANAALELAPSNERVARIVRDAFSETEAYFRELIEEGRRSGDIAASVDPALAARSLLGLLLGMRVLARAGAAHDVLGAIARQAQALIE
jgi:TetR/AcrR family transcriptional repressor of nem operon